MQLPSAIIFVNSDISSLTEETIKSQLYITEVVDGYEFDDRVAVDPNYPDIIHNNDIRLLVKKDFADYANRNLADVAMFVKQGLASVEKNKFGPPGFTVPIIKFNIWDLLRYAGSSQVVILPEPPQRLKSCECCCCGKCEHRLGGIFAIQAIDSSGVHCRNPDNESNNEAFINRK